MELIDKIVTKMLDTAFYAGDDWRSDSKFFTVVGNKEFISMVQKSIQTKVQAVQQRDTEIKFDTYISVNGIEFQINEDESVKTPILYISNKKHWDGEYIKPRMIDTKINDYIVDTIIDVV